MKWSLAESRFRQLLKHRALFVRLAFIELGIIALLSAGIIVAFYQQRIVVVPAAMNQSFWVGQGAVSPEYLSEMTYFLMNLRFTVSPATAAWQRELLLRHTDPAYYPVLNNLLVAEADKLEKEHISLTFFPVTVRVNSHQLQAEVTGDLVSTVGNQVLPAVRVTYEVNYRYHGGRLLISALKEQTIHA